MNRNNLLIAATLLGSFALAVPANAQHRGGAAGPSSGGRAAAPATAPRPVSPPAAASGRAPSAPSVAPSGRAAPRANAPYVYGRYAPFGRSAPYYYPYSRLGLGLDFYYGFGYPYLGWYPGLYGYPWGYGYPAPYYGYGYGGYGFGGSGSAAAYGGLRISDAPPDAEVMVDGYYAGVAGDFDGTFQRLSLEPGAHHIELRASGFAPLAFDVNVQPGQTINYRAHMLADGR
jgi:hypothetical protein